MKVNEIFLSIQGESSSIGKPTIFVRFTGCNLRCSYCDTKYAYTEGIEMTISEIMSKIESFSYKRVCLTGGEPLLQEDIQDLLDRLKDYEVSIETNGSIDLSNIKLLANQRFIMDIKLRTSECFEKMHFDNFRYLTDNLEMSRSL